MCKGELPMSSPENTGLRCKVTCDREKVVVTPPRPLRPGNGATLFAGVEQTGKLKEGSSALHA